MASFLFGTLLLPRCLRKSRLFLRNDLAWPRFAVDVGDGQGPEWREVDSGDEFAGKRGQKLPVPAQKPGEDTGHAKVDDVVGRRFYSCEENREENDLDNIGEDCQQQRGLHARAGRDAEVALAWGDGLRCFGHTQSIGGRGRGSEGAREREDGD